MSDTTITTTTTATTTKTLFQLPTLSRTIWIIFGGAAILVSGLLYFLKSRSTPKTKKKTTTTTTKTKQIPTKDDSLTPDYFDDEPEYRAELKTDLSELLKDIEKQFSVTSRLEEIRDTMLREMREGLHNDSQSSLKMIPTFVTKLPHGLETGTAYALDIGGSNIRVLKVNLDGNGHVTADEDFQVKYEIPPRLMKSNSEDLFAYIAECVGKIVSENQSIGFTFSFPIEQHTINSGVLMKWTKGFTAEGVVGNDIVDLLNVAFRRENINVAANALINDTVGTLLTGAYQEVNQDCCIALILGTGSNACYVESIKNIEKLHPPLDAEGFMIINMESGNFGSRPDRIGVDLPLTKWDKMLDLQSNNQRHQILEKQISGMYLGEIVRILLVDLINNGFIFQDFRSDISNLEESYSFPTKEMSEIENDQSVTLDVVASKLETYGITRSTLEERKFVKSVIRIIAARGAMLSATQIAACLRQMNKENKNVVVAIDGSVFEKYPNFKTIMEETLLTLLKHNKVRLVLAKDGSGVGAALASFMQSKSESE